MILGSSALFLASLLAWSLPMIFAWALTFLMVMLCCEIFMACIMFEIRSLSKWLF